MFGLAETFGLVEGKREVQFDLPLRLTPLPLLRWARELVQGTEAQGGEGVGYGNYSREIPNSAKIASSLVRI